MSDKKQSGRKFFLNDFFEEAGKAEQPMQETPIEPCKFCNGKSQTVAKKNRSKWVTFGGKHQKDIKFYWSVRCNGCGARGPQYKSTLERGRENDQLCRNMAIDYWNNGITKPDTPMGV